MKIPEGVDLSPSTLLALIPDFPIQHLSLKFSTINLSLFFTLISIFYLYMSKQSIIIYDFEVLFNILNEVKENLKFQLFKVNSDQELQMNQNKYGNYLIIANSKKKINDKRILILNEFPIRINKLIEILNIQLIKQKYIDQSKIEIKKYNLDLNSREIMKNEKKLKLTEREIDIILYLNENKKPQNIEALQKKVWGHVSDLETHTVETHIYRLRKKLKIYLVMTVLL